MPTEQTPAQVLEESRKKLMASLENAYLALTVHEDNPEQLPRKLMMQDMLQLDLMHAMFDELAGCLTSGVVCVPSMDAVKARLNTKLAARLAACKERLAKHLGRRIEDIEL
jgi:hypothetical protein